jgi:hypothetical protein
VIRPSVASLACVFLRLRESSITHYGNLGLLDDSFGFLSSVFFVISFLPVVFGVHGKRYIWELDHVAKIDGRINMGTADYHSLTTISIQWTLIPSINDSIGLCEIVSKHPTAPG